MPNPNTNNQSAQSLANANPSTSADPSTAIDPASTDLASQVSVDDELRDIHGYHGIEIPGWIVTLFWIIVIAAIAYFIYWKFFRKDKKNELSALERTLRELDTLDISLASKEFYLKYSEIVKKYFEQDLGLSVMDKTIEELKPILKKAELIRTDQAIWITESFQRADLSKFAKKEVSPEEKANDSKIMVRVLNDIHEAKLAKEEAEKLKAKENGIDHDDDNDDVEDTEKNGQPKPNDQEKSQKAQSKNKEAKT